MDDPTGADTPPTFSDLAEARAAYITAMHGDDAADAARRQLRYARELNNADYIVLCEAVCRLVEHAASSGA